METEFVLDVTTGEGEVVSYTPTPIAPQVVSARQAKRALLAAGLLGDVEAAIEAISDATEREAARIDWEYATEFRRDNEMLNSIGAALELTEGQIDDLFIAAGAVV